VRVFRLLIVPTMVVGMFALLTATAYADSAQIQAQFTCSSTTATKVCFNLTVSTFGFPSSGRDVTMTLLGHMVGAPPTSFVTVSGPQTLHLDQNLDMFLIQVCFTPVTTGSLDALKLDIKAVGTNFTVNGQTEVVLGTFTQNCIAPPIVTQILPLGQRLAIETYYDVASSAQVSAGGYGGPGHSGGSGDALIRLVDVGNFTVSTNNDPGALCANFYVFDDDQQEQACCSCLITANGTTTTSVITNPVANPAFSNAKTSLGAVKVVGSFGTCTNTPPTAATLTAVNLAEGLKGWINHAEKIATNLPPSFAFVTSTSVERFTGVPLDSGELTELTSNCAAIVHQASGAGICSCGVGL